MLGKALKIAKKAGTLAKNNPKTMAGSAGLAAGVGYLAKAASGSKPAWVENAHGAYAMAGKTGGTNALSAVMMGNPYPGQVRMAASRASGNIQMTEFGKPTPFGNDKALASRIR